MKLILISNRLPIILERDEAGWQIGAGSGGLVTALGPILRQQAGTWIGWPGVTDRESEGVEQVLSGYSQQAGYDLVPVLLSPDELHGFYHGFSNEIIWPLFHDLQSRCNFVPDYWATYQGVTQKFADVVERSAGPEDFLWIQDYQLMGLGAQLRERGVRNSTGFFLHIPFPPPDIFCKLPWRSEILESLLWYDVIGLQTSRDRDNFLDCVHKLLRRTQVRRLNGMHRLTHQGRSTTVGTFPIGIDYAEFADAAAHPEIRDRAQAIRGNLSNLQIILSVDRLDYTKGITWRLKAFRLALQRYPELRRRVTLLQVVVPSRTGVPEYQDLKAEIERLVSQVNGEFTQPGWVPIHHVFKSLDRRELLTYYRAADIAFVTPLKDGMNLVSKEYCACQVDGNGVLILSEFAGAAAQLDRGAILVNPYDADGVAEALRRAIRMPFEQRRIPMRRLRNIVRRQDVHWWAERFLSACGVRKAPNGRQRACRRRPSRQNEMELHRSYVSKALALADR